MKKKISKEKIVMAITIGIASLALMLVMFMQFKVVEQTDITGIENMRESDLRVELADWQTKYEELNERYQEVVAKMEEYQNEKESGEETAKLLETELAQLNMILGKTDVEGEGIEIVIQDNEGAELSEGATVKAITEEDLLKILQELWGAGAEAISINGKRIIAMSDVVSLQYFLKVNGDRILSPYVIKAIGNQSYLESSVKGKGGHVDELEDLGHTVTIEKNRRVKIEKYEGFYVSRYEAGNNNNTLASQEGLRVVNAVTYEQAKGYAESMYRMPKVKSGLLTGTMWDTMTKWIANEKGEEYVINNIDSGNTYETAFIFSGMYAEGPNSVTDKRGAYITGINVNKLARTRALLTTGIVEEFKDKNIYDTAGNVWEYTSEYLINDENTKEYIARGGNYYWPYDRIVAAGTALREYVSDIEGQARNEGGFRVALFLVDGASEVGVFEDFNRTIDGGAPAYNNPVIPAGFAAVNEGAYWGNGSTVKPDWNNGLVIEDVNGNQFVWVPIDGTDVKYEKWTNVGIYYDEVTGDDLPEILSEWKETDKTQVEKFGGFYSAALLVVSDCKI